VLRLAAADAEIGRDVFCPSLATGVGCAAPEQAAERLARAYVDWKAALGLTGAVR